MKWMIGKKNKMLTLEYDYVPFNESHNLDYLDSELPDEFLSLVFQHKKILRPDWWKPMSLFKYGYNNAAEMIKNKYMQLLEDNTNSYRTVKTCPGLGALFNRAINMKWPCDVFLQTTEEGVDYKSSNSRFISIGIHKQEFQGHLNDVLFVKVTFPLAIRNYQFDVSFQDPILYNNTPFRVSPGMLLSSRKPITLSTFLIFPKIEEQYFFKQGEIMTTLVLSQPGVDVKRVNMYNEVSKYRSDLSSSFFESKWSQRNVNNG